MKDETWNGFGFGTEIEIEMERSVLLEILAIPKNQSVAFQNYDIWYYQYR